MELREQRLLEGRNAICMAFGRVSPMSKQKSFEELAVMFEGSGANGAERAYRRALDKLRLKRMESGMVHTVTLKQVKSTKKNKKIAAAAYHALSGQRMCVARIRRKGKAFPCAACGKIPLLHGQDCGDPRLHRRRGCAVRSSVDPRHQQLYDLCRASAV